MDGFMINQIEIEKIAMEHILPFLDSYALDGRIIIITNKYMQKNCGDIVYSNNHNDSIVIEIKSEASEKYNNFFLETWSNRKWRTVGWMVTNNSDYLFYFFVDTKKLYVINMHKLIKWCFEDGRMFDYPEKKQRKNIQLNDTYGRCVPIEVIKNEVGLKVYCLNSQKQIAKPKYVNQMSIWNICPNLTQK